MKRIFKPITKENLKINLKKVGLALLPAFLVTLVLCLLCGFLYPLFMTGVSQVILPKQANGSLVTADGKLSKAEEGTVGSAVVGQLFTEPYFMKGRPSAVNYNTVPDGEALTLASGSSNYGAINPALVERIKEDLAKIDCPEGVEVPQDLLTQSGSGLDPHISVESAQFQIPSIAKASGLTEAQLQEIVDHATEGKLLGVFGTRKVNVLKVNLEIAQKMGLNQ